MKKITLSVLALFLMSQISFSQTVQKSLNDLKSQTQATITVNQTFGIAEFIKFPQANPLVLDGNTVYDKAITFLETHKGIYDIKTVDGSFSLEATKTDNYGFEHLILLQMYEGVPIFDGKLKFHFNRDQKLTAVNGNYIPNIKLNPIPNLSQARAGSIAIETINNQDINYSGTPLDIKESTLYVFQKGLVQGYRGGNYLVYKIEVANDNDVREFVYVDAHNGNIVEQFTGIAHALDRVVYENNTSNTVWQEGDAFPGTLTNDQQSIVVASGHVYNLFKNAFGFVSYNGADAQMHIVSNTSDPAVACPNAWWNGSTVNLCDGVASDNTVGHEWAHAYTQYTSGLIYAWQSGAINESYSDIWGETIDLNNNYGDETEDLSLRTGCNSSDRWMNAEGNSAYPGPNRDMWDPTCLGDPGKVTDDEYWCTVGDNGGVHRNSGVPNHAYALLVDGGTYNGQTISGIGFTKAAHIFWRAQSQYLTSTSDFVSLANALETACSDLMGINLEGLSTTDVPVGSSGEIITAGDLDQVTNAILAVELRIVPECYGTILQPLVNELCEEATESPIFFEDWETGFGSWTMEELPVNEAQWIPRNWQLFNTGTPEDGMIAYGPAPNFGNCATNIQSGIIRLTSPLITMPDEPDATFEMAFSQAFSIENSWDGANIKYSVDGGSFTLLPIEAFIENPYNDPSLRASDNPLSGEPGFTGTDIGTNEFTAGTSVIDLASIGVIENSTIQFRFEVGTDGCDGDNGWFIDEIMVYNCGALSTPEFALENAITVYPNPSNGIFTLKKTSSINLLKATIYDLNGRLIKSVDLQNMSNSIGLDLSYAASGMYFMAVESQNSRRVFKLIKE